MWFNVDDLCSESAKARTSIFTDAKARKAPAKKRTYAIRMGVEEDANFNRERPMY